MEMDLAAMGLDNAAAVSQFFGVWGNLISGARWRSANRDDGKTNRQVQDYLIEGGRDFTATDEDAKAAGQKLVIMAAMEAQRVASRPSNFKRGTTLVASVKNAEAEGRRKSRQAQAKAYRAAARVIQKIVIQRLENSQDNTGSTAKSVTDETAYQRFVKHGIPDDTSLVYIDSGQLLENFASAASLELIRG